MQRLKLTDLISFDRDFDRFPGVNRVEPPIAT
jgi:predicted nucleic acid-binding protein